MKKKSKIVFFGNEKLATGLASVKPIIQDAIVAAGFEIEQVVTGPLTDLKPHTAKLAVLAAYGHIVPESIMDEFPLGIINIHPSLLPKYRGSTPIEAAILAGDSKTGVSIMCLTAAMDEGPIYKQKSIQLSGKETKEELANTLQNLGAEMLKEVLPAIDAGTLKPRQQSHPDRDASYCKKISREDGRIGWTKQAEQIEREIRAYAGWPGSHTTLGQVEVIIMKAHFVPSDFGSLGEINVEDEIGVLMIQAKDGYLCIDALKPVGKKEMPVKAFLNGYKSRLGTQAV